MPEVTSDSGPGWTPQSGHLLSHSADTQDDDCEFRVTDTELAEACG